MDTYCYGPGESISSPCSMDLKFKTEIKPVIGGGTSDYNSLLNKPSINGITLEGNKTTEDLMLVLSITNEEIDELLK